jgi:CDP-L-myo-inositol myo-inositolphosphotransferase
MQAVIIAAGQGSRLSPLYSPKPLMPVYGLRILERIILAGRYAGVRDFKIVVGYKAQSIMRTIGDGGKYDVSLEYIVNDEWQKGNGLSVLKARDYVDGRFLLLMADHIFDEAMLKKLMRADVSDGQCLLCVDKNLTGTHFDPDDVTKVYCNNGRIVRIGKSLRMFNAVDTGVFLCTPAIFQALEESIKRGQYTLAAGNQILADRAKLAPVDVTGCFWVDIDNEAALRKAQKILIQKLFKPTDGPVSKKINRRISTRLSAFLARFNVSPNALTLTSFALALLSAAFFSLGGYVNGVAAGIMAQLSSILDGCDGEIARLKFRFSTFGEWLDKLLDRYADGFILLGMTHAVWRSSANELVWLVGFLALIGMFMNSYTAAFYDELLRRNVLGGSTLRLGRDVRLFIIFLGSLANQLFATIAVLAVITNFESFRRVFLLKGAYGTKIGN